MTPPGTEEGTTKQPVSARLSVLTVGHSNCSLDSFIDLLKKHKVEVLVDVRSKPYSGYAAHFCRDVLAAELPTASIKYLFLGHHLGGRPDAPGCYDAAGNVLYDVVEQQQSYKEGIERLLKGIGRYRVCLMCGEEDPIRCHRRLLVARSLLTRGVEVRHIRRDGSIESEAEVQARIASLEPQEKQLSLL